MIQAEVVRESAIADAYMLLAMMLDFPTQQLAEGLASGAVQRDALAIAEEAGMGEAWKSSALAHDLTFVKDSIGAEGEEELLKAMRIEHTRLFDHPENPAVNPYESQFLYMRKLEEGLRTDSEWGMLDERQAKRGLRLGETFGEHFGRGANDGSRAADRGKRMASAQDYFDERPRMFVSPAALDAERCYKAAGLKRADAKNIPGDHIVTELQFMGRLHSGCARALMDGDEEANAIAKERIAEFERIHLKKWGEEFFTLLNRESRLGAYRLAGDLGVRFLSWRLRQGGE